MLAERFMKLFSGLDRAHGVFEIQRKNQAGKMTGKAKTVASAPTLELWRKHTKGEQGIGIVPIKDDATVSFAAIDIDTYDIDIDKLEERINELKLPLLICQSKSGGVHAYLFCKDPISAELVRSRLEEWAVVLGHPGVEIFPKQNELCSDKDVGNWLNMPYFGDQRVCRKNKKDLSAEDFLNLAEKESIDEETFAAIETPQHKLLQGAPPCLQALALKGFPVGGRNNALFNLGVYARLKTEDSWEEEIEKLNRELFKQPLNHKEVAGVIKSVNKKDYFYTCEQTPISTVCNKHLCRSREFGVASGEGEPSLLPEGLQKLLYTPPRWILRVEGVNIEADTKTLMRQDLYLQLILEQLNRFPPPAKAGQWRKHIDLLLQAVEEVEVPLDASDFGQFQYYLETFCVSRKQAREKEEITLGKPWTDGDKTYFRSGDLIKYMDQNGFKLSTRQTWSWLRILGANHKQLNLRGHCVQVWIIPAYQQTEEEYPVPKIGEKDDF